MNKVGYSVCRLNGGGGLLDNWESLCTQTKWAEGIRESCFCLSFIYLFYLNASAFCAYIICLWFNLKLRTDWEPIILLYIVHVNMCSYGFCTVELSPPPQLSKIIIHGTFIHMLVLWAVHGQLSKCPVGYFWLLMVSYYCTNAIVNRKKSNEE